MSTVPVVPSPRGKLTLFVSPAVGADESGLELGRHAAGAELDDGVALRLPRGVDEVDHERVALLRGPPVRRRQLGDGLAQRLDLGLDGVLRDLDLGARDLERRPVDDLGERLHVDRRGEAPALVRGRRELVLELRLGHGPDAGARRGAPEPAADVAVHGLRVDPALAEPGDQERLRHLALAEARDLGRLGEVGERVLDRVLDLFRRHLDGEPDAVLAELLDGRGGHAGHSTSLGRGQDG